MGNIYQNSLEAKSSSNLFLAPSVQKNLESECSSWLLEGMLPSENDTSIMVTKVLTRNIYGIVFVALQMVLGLIGNSVVLLVYYTKYRRSNYRTFVLFLAILDIGSCVLTMPFVIVFLYNSMNFPSDFVCRAGLLVGFTFGVAQSGALVLIAFDRYRKICHPLKKQISQKQAKASCIAVVFMALSVTWFTPFLYGTSTRTLGKSRLQVTQCYLAEDNLPNMIAKAYYILLAVLFVIVSTFLCVLYFFIMKKVHGHSKSFYSVKRSPTVNTISRNKSLRTTKTTLTFCIITAVYILCTIPHDALGMVFHLVDDLECRLNYSGGTAFFLFYWTVFLNNIANPLIYGLSDDRFRDVIKSYIVKRRLSAESGSSQQVSDAYANPVARSLSSVGQENGVCLVPDPTDNCAGTRKDSN